MSNFGKVSPLVGDAGAWVGTDATKSWSDGGDVDKALAPAAEALKVIVAKHVKDAVLEYASSAEYGLAVSQSQIFVSVRLWDEAASFTTHVPLRSLLNAALKEAYAKAADPKAQELMTAVAVLAKDLTAISQKKGAAA